MPARSLVPGEADGGRQFPVGALRLFLPVSQQGLPVLDEPPAADQVVVADAAKPEPDELMTTVLKRQAIAYLLPQSKRASGAGTNRLRRRQDGRTGSDHQARGGCRRTA